MVANTHYRWDFIGLSTDEKPTPATSEKVVDGSTFYCSDNSKLYVYYKTQWYEKTASGGGGGGTTYTAGDGITISDDTISVDTTTIQPKLTAGTNITIEDNSISATDTTYSNFTGTDGTAAGAAGLVPAPATTDAGKFLKADGTWDTAGGGSITVETTPGISATNPMSQLATTKLVYGTDSSSYNAHRVQIGSEAESTGTWTVAIGTKAKNYANNTIAIGQKAEARSAGQISLGQLAGNGINAPGSTIIGDMAGAAWGVSNAIALGNYAKANSTGEMNIGTGTQATAGYNSSNYRLLSGVYDGQSAHDAATKGQLDTAIINGGTTAPTTATVGAVGTLYSCVESGTPHLYSCTDTTGGTYTWSQLV